MQKEIKSTTEIPCKEKIEKLEKLAEKSSSKNINKILDGVNMLVRAYKMLYANGSKNKRVPGKAR